MPPALDMASMETAVRAKNSRSAMPCNSRRWTRRRNLQLLLAHAWRLHNHATGGSGFRCYAKWSGTQWRTGQEWIDDCKGHIWHPPAGYQHDCSKRHLHAQWPKASRHIARPSQRIIYRQRKESRKQMSKQQTNKLEFDLTRHRHRTTLSCWIKKVTQHSSVRSSELLLYMYINLINKVVSNRKSN